MSVFLFVLIAFAVMAAVGVILFLAATAGDGRAARKAERLKRRTLYKPPAGNTRPRNFDYFGRPY